jgi:hypothetical protein
MPVNNNLDREPDRPVGTAVTPTRASGHVAQRPGSIVSPMTSTSAATRLGDLASVLVDRVRGHYGPGPRSDDLAAALTIFASDQRPVDPDSLARVEVAAQTVFRHLELTHANNLHPQDRSPGWPDPDLTAIRRTGANITAVHRDPDGTATIALTGLADVEAAAPLLAGGPPRHLFDVVYRDHTRQWWTAGSPLAEPPDVPVRVLIGPRTASSGEALAWVLHDQRLATLVGEPTRGAADHVVPIALSHDVHALIPEAHVVAPDGSRTWEGHGVQPDETADPTEPAPQQHPH